VSGRETCAAPISIISTAHHKSRANHERLVEAKSESGGEKRRIKRLSRRPMTAQNGRLLASIFFHCGDNCLPAPLSTSATESCWLVSLMLVVKIGSRV
jgi:hypothetical protein